MSTLLSTNKTTWLDNTNIQMIKHTYTNMEQRWKAGHLAYHQLAHGFKKRRTCCSGLANKSHRLVGPISSCHPQVTELQTCPSGQDCHLRHHICLLIAQGTPDVDTDTSPHQDTREQWEMSDTGCRLVHWVHGRLTNTVACVLVQRWGPDEGLWAHVCDRSTTLLRDGASVKTWTGWANSTCDGFIKWSWTLNGETINLDPFTS